ncbi:MAG: hypothetical protein H6811_07910 [Phycisphaeraceae bacterium]|nr:hypothetical protein [Phycisphaeraceae bacterium]
MRSATLAVVCACGSFASALPPSEFIAVPWGVGNPADPRAGSIGMFSVVDGSYLGDLVPPDQAHIVWPTAVAIGPDRMVYVSDSTADSVWRYNLKGEFVDRFLGPADGLGIVRDILLYEGDLLVVSIPRAPAGLDYTLSEIKRFGFDGVEKAPFVGPGTNFSFWDMHPVGNGDLLISDSDSMSGVQAGVYHFSDDGVDLGRIYPMVFSTQIVDGHEPGHFYGYAFNARVTEFTLAGTIRGVTLAGLSNAGRGIHPLDDGSLLAVSYNAGVYVHNVQTGARIRTIRTGFGLYGQANRFTVCWADLTNDLSVDSDDFFAFLDAFATGDLEDADWSGSSDPNDPGYGVPDGALDADDFFYFLDLFQLGCP